MHKTQQLMKPKAKWKIYLCVCGERNVKMMKIRKIEKYILLSVDEARIYEGWQMQKYERLAKISNYINFIYESMGMILIQIHSVIEYVS